MSTWHFLLFFKDTHSNYRNDNIILSLGPIKVHLIIVAEVLRSKQIIKNPQNLNIENIYSSFKGLQIKKVLNVILKACEKQMDKSQFSNSPLLTLWRMPGCISWIERRHIISKYFAPPQKILCIYDCDQRGHLQMIYDKKKVIKKFPAGLYNTQIYSLVWAAFADFLSLCWFATGMIWRKMVQKFCKGQHRFHTFQIIVKVFCKISHQPLFCIVIFIGDLSYGIFMNFQR